MAQATHTRQQLRFRMLRRSLVIVAVMALLLTSQMSALASEVQAPAEGQDGVVTVLMPDAGGALDLSSGLDDGATAAKGPVSVWGKCQVPGKCEVGVSIKIRF